MKFIFLFPLVFTATLAQNFSASLDLKAYTGKWYQVYSDLFVQNTFEKGARCVEAFYNVAEDDIIEIYNQQIGPNTKIQSITGYGYIPNQTEPRKLKVVLKDKNEADYWIYDVGPILEDKYQYSIVSDSYKVNLFVLARNVQDFYVSYNEHVLQKLEDYGFTRIWNKPKPTIQDCY